MSVTRTPAATQQLVYRNLAAVNLWAMARAMDPSLPAWEALDARQQRACANAVVAAASEIWFKAGH